MAKRKLVVVEFDPPTATLCASKSRACQHLLQFLSQGYARCNLFQTDERLTVRRGKPQRLDACIEADGWWAANREAATRGEKGGE